MSAGDRRLLLVVGIGRSGTSMFTGILGQLGWHVPQPEVQADDTNPAGFGEPQWVVDFHKQLQRSCRVTNMDSRPAAFDLAAAKATDPQVVTRLREWLGEQFEQSAHVVVKDPRVVWFLPLWQQAAADLGVETSFATMLRYPTEILKSARTWYGAWQSDASRAASWLNVMLRTEQLTRGAPRAFVRYDELLSDWEAQITRIAAPLRAEWMADLSPSGRDAVNEFVDPTLRRSQVGWDEIVVPEVVRSMVDLAWERFVPLAAGSSEPADAARPLDELAERYQQFYAEVEATAQSSIHAARRLAPAAPKPPPPPPTRRQVLARRMPARVRALVPVRLRRRMLGRG
ncbi:MAG TPA: hypothetical protein VFJ17_04470 [Mycobacteriales bacterium]|nr:hypothetical protein [Mycobacteriales bacterium]